MLRPGIGTMRLLEKIDAQLWIPGGKQVYYTQLLAARLDEPTEHMTVNRTAN